MLQFLSLSHTRCVDRCGRIVGGWIRQPNIKIHYDQTQQVCGPNKFARRMHAITDVAMRMTDSDTCYVQQRVRVWKPLPGARVQHTIYTMLSEAPSSDFFLFERKYTSDCKLLHPSSDLVDYVTAYDSFIQRRAVNHTNVVWLTKWYTEHDVTHQISAHASIQCDHHSTYYTTFE